MKIPLIYRRSVTTEPKQNETNFEENDEYAGHPMLECKALTRPAILDSFDTRLGKLEKSILPLYTATQILSRRRNSKWTKDVHWKELRLTWLPDIDKTLEKIEDLANNQQDLSVDESLILRGCGALIYIVSLVDFIVFYRPQPGQIGVYKDALERLNTSIAFNAADLDLAAAVSSPLGRFSK